MVLITRATVTELGLGNGAEDPAGMAVADVGCDIEVVERGHFRTVQCQVVNVMLVISVVA